MRHWLSFDLSAVKADAITLNDEESKAPAVKISDGSFLLYLYMDEREDAEVLLAALRSACDWSFNKQKSEVST